jgi:hypothetical protein
LANAEYGLLSTEAAVSGGQTALNSGSRVSSVIQVATSSEEGKANPKCAMSGFRQPRAQTTSADSVNNVSVANHAVLGGCWFEGRQPETFLLHSVMTGIDAQSA